MLSWISFLIPVDRVPGRMSLLILIFLLLINTSIAVRAESPSVKGVTALDIWLLSCMGFVALSLMEYAGLLWLRYGTFQSLIKSITLPGMDEAKQKCDLTCYKADFYSIIGFPLMWGLFNLVYWPLVSFKS